MNVVYIKVLWDGYNVYGGCDSEVRGISESWEVAEARFVPAKRKDGYR